MIPLRERDLNLRAAGYELMTPWSSKLQFRSIGSYVYFQDRGQALENRPAEKRVTGEVPTHEPRRRPTTTGVHRRKVPCRDPLKDRRALDLVRSGSPAQMVRIAVRKHHDVAWRQLDIMPAFYTGPRRAIHDEVIDHDVRRARRQRRRQHATVGRSSTSQCLSSTTWRSATSVPNRCPPLRRWRPCDDGSGCTLSRQTGWEPDA